MSKHGVWAAAVDLSVITRSLGSRLLHSQREFWCDFLTCINTMMNKLSANQIGERLRHDNFIIRL